MSFHIFRFRVWSKFEFFGCHNLSFWVLSKYEFLNLSQFGFSHNVKFCIVTVWVFEFCQNMSYWVLSKFKFLSFTTIRFYQFGCCFSLSRFEFLSFVTILVFEVSHNLGLFKVWVFDEKSFWVRHFFWEKKVSCEEKKNWKKKLWKSFMVNSVFFVKNYLWKNLLGNKKLFAEFFWSVTFYSFGETKYFWWKSFLVENFVCHHCHYCHYCHYCHCCHIGSQVGLG